MAYEIQLVVTDKETDDIICRIETESLESLEEQLRKVEHAIAKANNEKTELKFASI